MSREDRETLLEFTNPWVEEGREEGRQGGLREAVLAVIEHKFGATGAALAGQIHCLDSERAIELLRLLSGDFTFQQLQGFLDRPTSH